MKCHLIMSNVIRSLDVMKENFNISPSLLFQTISKNT